MARLLNAAQANSDPPGIFKGEGLHKLRGMDVPAFSRCVTQLFPPAARPHIRQRPDQSFLERIPSCISPCCLLSFNRATVQSVYALTCMSLPLVHVKPLLQRNGIDCHNIYDLPPKRLSTLTIGLSVSLSSG